ncbi:ATP-binding protein [Amycolatopsis pigmentata]|uniref:ATP-binding protein n=1 Tax=Amycolatopsis pigmentata TaxID=450801 RepID=A0ABW5G4V5_9PSEU
MLRIDLQRNVDLRSVKLRGLLGLLLLNANSPVSASLIMRLIWDDLDGSKPRQELYRNISKARRVLGKTISKPSIAVGNGLYRLDVDHSNVDYHHFRRLVDEGVSLHRSGNNRGAIKILRQALAMWPDEPMLVNVPLPWVKQAEEELIDESFNPAVRAYFEACLAEGRGDSVIVEIERLMRRQELNETLAELRMNALSQLRGPDSVDKFFRAFVRRTTEELGADVSAHLKRLHRDLVEGRATAAAAGRLRVPVMLPRDIPDFLGRADVLARLDEWLLARGPAAVALHGVGGVGKTAVARHWATTRREHFPDGQLYFDLNGDSDPEKPTAVATGFLKELGADIPLDADRMTLLRHRIGDRRMLVFLDNVGSPDEIRPLLDATASCSVLLTTRQKPDLIGCRDLVVPRLRPVDAVEMIRRRIYDDRRAMEPAAVEEIAKLCDGLPLCLRIAGEYVVARSGMTIRTLADQLAAEERRRLLDAHSRTDGKGRSLRAVFDSSLSGFDPRTKFLFTVLGLHPHPYVSLAAATACAGMSATEVEDCFDSLVTAGFAEQKSETVYHLHDIMHAYGRDVARREIGDQQRTWILRRMFDFYLRTVRNAIRLISPELTEVPPLATDDSVVPVAFADRVAAQRWCFESRAETLAVARLAAEVGFQGHMWRTIGLFSVWSWEYSDDLDDVITLLVSGVRAAIKDASRTGEKMLLNNLGAMYLQIKKYREAEACLEQLRRFSVESGDLLAEAIAQHNMGTALLGRGRLNDAAKQYRIALNLFTRAGNEPYRGRAYLRLGDVSRRMDRPDEAKRYYVDSLAVFGKVQSDERADPLLGLASLVAESGDLESAKSYAQESLELYRHAVKEREMGNALLALAHIQCEMGEFPEAFTRAREAVRLADARGDLAEKARSLETLGEVRVKAGDVDSARTAWENARSLFDELHDARASAVTDRLTELNASESLPEQRKRSQQLSEGH